MQPTKRSLRYLPGSELRTALAGKSGPREFHELHATDRTDSQLCGGNKCPRGEEILAAAALGTLGRRDLQTDSSRQAPACAGVTGGRRDDGCEPGALAGALERKYDEQFATVSAAIKELVALPP